MTRVTPKKGYEVLADIHDQALLQAQEGKGTERHVVNGRAFVDQPIVQIGLMVGAGGPAQQVIKKTQEALRLPFEKAKAELLGAINYAAAVLIVLQHEEAEKAKTAPIYNPGVGVAVKDIKINPLNQEDLDKLRKSLVQGINPPWEITRK